jgi:hypothetical protein
MHWASHKGHVKVVWLLLQANMLPLEIDMHGNTSIHQAASVEEGLKVLKCFMSRGCDVGVKNARGHTPLDLATSDDTRQLIQKALKTMVCPGKKCGGSKFSFQNVRYYCESCTNFFCRMCSVQTWVFENKNSHQKERPVCRCLQCQDKISKAETDLQEAMEAHEFHTLNKVLSQI